MADHIYCFNLYCEGNGFTKSQAFVTIRENVEQAKAAAMAKNKSDFPESQGWYNHQASWIVIPDEVILTIAAQLKAEKMK